MQKIINGIAIASGVVSITLVGTVGVVYLNKDAIIDNIKKQAIEAVTGGLGLLEQMLAIALGLVVLFIGRSLPLELLALVFALRLPAARRNHSVMERRQGSKDVLMPF